MTWTKPASDRALLFDIRVFPFCVCVYYLNLYPALTWRHDVALLISVSLFKNKDGTIFSHFLVYTKPQILSNSQNQGWVSSNCWCPSYHAVLLLGNLKERQCKPELIVGLFFFFFQSGSTGTEGEIKNLFWIHTSQDWALTAASRLLLWQIFSC